MSDRNDEPGADSAPDEGGSNEWDGEDERAPADQRGDGEGEREESAPERAPVRPTAGRLERVGGFVLLAYVLWFLVELVVLRSNPLLFDRMHELSGALVARLATCVVAFALVYHALSGLRLMVLEATGGPSARVRTLVDTAVVFLTFALALPASAIILQPWIQGHLL